MSLKSFFPDHFDELRAFLVSEEEVVRCLCIDEGMRTLLLRALEKMEQADDFPHVFIQIDSPFASTESYFDRLNLAVDQTLEHNAEQLAEWGCEAPPADMNPNPGARFLSRATAFAESLPDLIGSVVFVLTPERIDDPDDFRSLVKGLAASVRTRWLKFLVLDSHDSPVLNGIGEENPDIGEQLFHLPPAEMERRIREDLEHPADLTLVEWRHYHGLLAGFAFARRDYDRAEQLQRTWVDEARKSGEPQELASAQYNLGNTLMAKGDLSAAVAVFCQACELCVDRKVETLTPFVYTGLGQALGRQGDDEQCIAALKVARDLFRAQRQIPGEAYVVDCLAQIYADRGSTHEATQAWRYVLSLYDGITAPHFQEVADAARQDVRAKLAAIGAAVDSSQSGDPSPQEASNP